MSPFSSSLLGLFPAEVEGLGKWCGADRVVGCLGRAGAILGSQLLCLSPGQRRAWGGSGFSWSVVKGPGGPDCSSLSFAPGGPRWDLARWLWASKTASCGQRCCRTQVGEHRVLLELELQEGTRVSSRTASTGILNVTSSRRSMPTSSYGDASKFAEHLPHSTPTATAPSTSGSSSSR